MPEEAMVGVLKFNTKIIFLFEPPRRLNLTQKLFEPPILQQPVTVKWSSIALHFETLFFY
jgi:hypothetical protein